MKVAIITPGGVDRSGTRRVIPCLLWFIERLVKCADDVHIFALRQEPEPGEWPLLGARVHNSGGLNAPARMSRTFAALTREHRRSPFDVVHALWAVPQGVLAAFARMRLGIPVLLHLPGGDLVRFPCLGYGGRLTLAGRASLHLAVSGADRVAAPSAYMVALALELGIAARHLPFGVALDRWPVATPRRRASGAPVRLLHVADLSPVKDQDTLLNAMVELRARKVPFTIDIIGEDQLHGNIMRRASELNVLEHVRFHGFVPQNSLKEFVYAADLLVVTSRHEAGPVVALEAAAAGVPAIGTRVGLLADWSPVAARAVPVGDSSALAAGISELFEREDERLNVAIQAQQRAIAGNADVTTHEIRETYASIIDERRWGARPTH